MSLFQPLLNRDKHKEKKPTKDVSWSEWFSVNKEKDL